ncbi:MAG: DMT family transporter [Coriobacteriia bacterium]|nr:DMT family transporter [Coriobacteriia bacterium]
MPQSSPHALRGYALALVAGVSWAGAGLISTWMRLDPMVVTGARTLSAALILGLGLLIFNRRGFKVSTSPRSLGFLLVYGALVTAGMQFTYFSSIKANGAALGTLLKYLSPVFLLVLGALFFKRRIRILTATAAAVALFGQALAIGLFSGAGLALTRAGLIWGVCNAVFFTLYTVMGEVGNDHYQSFSLLFYGLAIAAVLWLIVLGPVRVITPFLQVKPLLQLLLLASASTILPFSAYLVSMRSIDSAHASIAAMLEPVAAGVGGFLFFRQPLTVVLLAGGALSLGAIAIMRLSDIRQAC